jgi:hypothetical protein
MADRFEPFVVQGVSTPYGLFVYQPDGTLAKVDGVTVLGRVNVTMTAEDADA